MPELYDVFISYAHADKQWVSRLAENLHQAEIEVFYDEWRIGAGDVVVHALEDGILKSKNGIIVISPTSITRPWVKEEYAAMLGRTVEGKQKIIPVILEDAEIPPFLGSRLWVDFRNGDGPEYERKVKDLIKALKGIRPGPPPRIKPKPDTQVRPEGSFRGKLWIMPDKVAFSSGNNKVQHKPKNLSHRDEQRIWELYHTQQRRSSEIVYKPDRSVAEECSTVHTCLLSAGAALTRAYLDGQAGKALIEAVKGAESQNASLELGLEIGSNGLSSLPWETLRLPEQDDIFGQPLVLHPSVNLYRTVDLSEPAPVGKIPGPLRILVAIGSPEAQNTRGELLDMEKELALILDAVEDARRDGKAVVKILERGSVKAIQEALKSRRYHVLHISSHALPGALVLEDDEGREDRVNAERFWKEALVPNRGVPLVVLAGCSTALPVHDESGPLPGLSHDLLSHGVPAVVAMQASVSDLYAARLCAALYRELATHEHPDPLTALSSARRSIEIQRQKKSDERPDLAEWATPALYVRGPVFPLYDPKEDFESIPLEPELPRDSGLIVRRVGEFVGRRMEQRVLLKVLRSPDSAGVVVHGIGGVGKSTLAAQIMHFLAQSGWILVSVTGPLSVDQLLSAVGRRIHQVCLKQNRHESDPVRQAAVRLKDPSHDWQERLSDLSYYVTNTMPLVVLLDNFEDNLDESYHVKDRDLAELFSQWVEAAGKSRLFITSRYPVKLPDENELYLKQRHLGPLSLSETRKLVWRLKGLDALKPEQLQLAYEEVGGHPRALEYLDALLRGGEARFTDIEKRLRKALRKKGITDPGRWCINKKGHLDQSLAETIILLSGDVLLDDLLKRLTLPLSLELLAGASVYRVPVDKTALIYQTGTEKEQSSIKTEGHLTVIKSALAEGKLNLPKGADISDDMLQKLAQGLAKFSDTGIEAPSGMEQARELLQELGLLSVAQYAEDDPVRYIVHRWTAEALKERLEPEIIKRAHHRAARYWRWKRERTKIINKQQALEELLEARYHHYEAGEVDLAVEVTEWACLQLQTWGTWGRQELLMKETLTWLPEKSEKTAAFVHHLGMVSQDQGDYEEALTWYRKSLEIEEELGNRAGMANSYGQLGIVSQHQGDYEEALTWYRKSLEIKEELGNRAGMANSYGQLGIVSQEKGDYEEALTWYRKSLEIFEELGNRAGMANSYHNLGIVSQDQGDYEEALTWYRKSLEIEEELGNRAGMASTISQMGILFTEKGSPEQGILLNLKSLMVRSEIGVPQVKVDLHWLKRQQELVGEERFVEILKEQLDEKSVDMVVQVLDKLS
jgi:tetratricopeptide (TPR) repeat protein